MNSLLKYTCELAVDYYLTGHILPAAKFNILLPVALCESQSILVAKAPGTRSQPYATLLNRKYKIDLHVSGPF